MRIHRDTKQGRGSKSLEAHWRRQNHHCEDIMRCLQKGITEQDVQAWLNTAKGRVSCTTIRSNEKQHGTTQHNTAHQNTTTRNATASNNTTTSNIRYCEDLEITQRGTWRECQHPMEVLPSVIQDLAAFHRGTARALLHSVLRGSSTSQYRWHYHYHWYYHYH